MLNSNNVTLKVKRTGNIYILNNNYYCPSEVFLNGNSIGRGNMDNCHITTIRDLNTEIKLVWDNIYSSTSYMFSGCSYIEKIDMTNFNTSLVTNMNDMFASCTSLNSLIVSNFDTSKVRSFERMFYQCESLTSINLESFTNPSATTLAYMFYDCKNLEYINIKNFDEKENLDLNYMFYNIPPNAVICLSSCPPPKNIFISEMDIIKIEATISWEGYEWNKFIISYGLQNFANPENGNKIYVTDARNYTFTNLTKNKRYDIYIKTDCDMKTSYWIGPLLVSIESYNMRYSGTSSITTCSMVIYDSGGPYHNYQNNANSVLNIHPPSSNNLIYITGIVYTETNYDILRIKNRINDYNINELNNYSGYINIPLLFIYNGFFVLEFTSDSFNTYPGFQLTVGCMINSPQTIYSLIKDKSCYKISCDSNWKNIQDVSVSCIRNCKLTRTKYQYRGKCYNSCPEGTVDINSNKLCFLKNVQESCELYSIASELENACLKCKSDYYTIFNDKNNKNNFVHCYKNNSLEKYYLDNNDLLFKPCYISCKTCDQAGTIENSNCLSCDNSYYQKYEDLFKNETYKKCYKEIVGYALYNNQYFIETLCYKSCLLCSKEGNVTHHNCLKCKKDYPYELNYSYGLNCYKECEFEFFLYSDKDKGNLFCLPYNDCNNYYNKKKLENIQCIYDCNVFPNYPLENKQNYFYLYPNNKQDINIEKELYCEIYNKNNNLYYEFYRTEKCISKCALFQLNNNTYILDYKNEKEQNMLDHIKEDIINGIQMTEIDNKEYIFIQGNAINLAITKSKINSQSGTSNIDLGICEEKLKTIYNISYNESLYILKMEVKQEGYKIPKIQYEVYYPLNNDTKLTQLNLSNCENFDMNIYIHLELNGNLDQYIPSSDFYNDICTTFTSENGTDLTISGRKKYYINNKLAICEEHCIFVKYNKTDDYIICSCKVKTDFVKNISLNKFDEEELHKSFTDFYNIFNIKVLKCIKSIFTVEAFKKNYANIILIIIIILYFACLIFFIIKSYKNDIIFYIDIITYFNLFPKNINDIIRKKEKSNLNFLKLFNTHKEGKKDFDKNIKNRVNTINKRDSNKIRYLKDKNTINIKPPIYNIILELRNKLNNKNDIKYQQPKMISLNDNTKKRNLKKGNIINKLKTEAITNEKLIKNINNYEEFKKLTEDQLYEIYKKIYSKTDNELNDLPYKLALKFDRRTYFQFYFSLLKSNHLLFFSFIPNLDFNSRIIKIYLFFFNFATYFFVNALFFTDETMGKINIDGGAFNFIYNLPQIICSSIISAVINIVIKLLAITEDNFIEFRNKSKKEKQILILASKLKTKYKIKFIFFFIIDLMFLGCFWIYLSCFSAVYHNTQIHLIKDTLISFGTSFISPLAIYLLPGIFRIPALKNNNRKIIYGISKIIQLL